MKLARIAILTTLLFASLPAVAMAEADANEASHGFYAKAGFAWAGSPSYDFSQGFLDFFGTGGDSTSLYGFQALGGYRWFGWLGTDFEIVYATGGEVRVAGTKVSDSSAFAGAVVARIYPIEWFRDPGRRSFEWSLDLGLGGGRFFEDTAISLGESSLLVRVGTGLDWWLSDHWGVYLDGGYFVATSDAVNGFGFIGVGGAYRF